VLRGAKSRMRRTETPEPIWIKFCMVVDIAVIYTNFGDHRLRVFCGGEIFPSPIFFHRRTCNSLERVIDHANELVQLQSFKELNIMAISHRFQRCVSVHSKYCCLTPHSWTAILAVIANTIFTVSLHSKVQFAPHLPWAKRHHCFRSDFENVCGFCKTKIVAKYEEQRPFLKIN